MLLGEHVYSYVKVTGGFIEWIVFACTFVTWLPSSCGCHLHVAAIFMWVPYTYVHVDVHTIPCMGKLMFVYGSLFLEVNLECRWQIWRCVCYAMGRDHHDCQNAIPYCPSRQFGGMTHIDQFIFSPHIPVVFLYCTGHQILCLITVTQYLFVFL